MPKYRYGSYQMACAQATQHEDDRQRHEFEKAKKQGVEFVEMDGVKIFGWSKQSEKAVFFKSFGWVPKTALAWRRTSGEIVRWGEGRGMEDNVLLVAKWIAEKGVN